MLGCTGIRTLVTGVAARNAADWAMQAFDRCGLLHIFNLLSHAATTGVWLAVVRIVYTRCNVTCDGRENRHYGNENIIWCSQR